MVVVFLCSYSLNADWEQFANDFAELFQIVLSFMGLETVFLLRASLSKKALHDTSF